MRVIESPADEFPVNPANINDIANGRVPFNRMNLIAEYPEMTAEQAGVMAFF
jgi:hypothetical protein